MSEDRINKIVKRLCFIILIIICNVIRCQTYYGKNNFGKLEFINDSVCELNFYHYISIYSPLTNYCKYTKHGDTIFLSSEYQNLYFLELYDTIQKETKGLPILIKTYAKSDDKYKLMGESIYSELDTTDNSIIINDGFIDYSEILVLCIYPFYDIRCYVPIALKNHLRNNSNRYSIKINLNHIIGQIYLSNFPLLVKRNKLVPIDENMQLKCWVENGFYFPTMIKKTKNKRYNTINYCFRALYGLPNGYGYGLE